MSVRKAILKKLFRHSYIGARHTEIRNAMKGLLPPMLLNEAKQEIKNLIKQGYLLSKMSTGEMHVSLNPKKLKDVRKDIE